MIKLSDFVDWMKDIYKTIDLRVATGKIEDEWINALTVVRFSNQERETIKTRFKDIESRIGEIKTDNFQILHHVFDFEELYELSSQFQHGKIRLDDFEIKYESNIDLCSREYSLPSTTTIGGSFPAFYGSIRRIEEWPTLEIYQGMESKVFKKHEIIENEVRKFGFDNIYEPVRGILEIENSRESFEFDVAISAPFYARIKDFDFEGQTAKTKVEFHENVTGLVLNLVLRGTDLRGQIKVRQSFEMVEEEIKNIGDAFKVWESVVGLPLATRNDSLMVKLAAHKESLEELGEIDSSKNSVDYFRKIKEPARMPFFSTFSRFCNEKELREQLTQPHGLKIPGVGGADKVFERSILWLLNLVGYPAIKLDKYEKLKDGTTSVDLGSVDVLAYNDPRRLLLLINCTIGIPKGHEIESYNNVRDRLYDELFKDSDIQIISVVFSAQRGLELTKEDGKKMDVKIFDVGDIESILDHHKRGEFESIRKMLED